MSFALNKRTVGPFLKRWHGLRHKARTDLLWFCNNILDYVDVSYRVHGPILDALQKFPGVKESHQTVEDFLGAFQENRILWEPKVDLWTLTGPRKNLFLYPRGHLKSTVITMAHSIQWIINYPDIRILFSSGTGDQVQKFIAETKSPFLHNEKFRFLFPEFCPPAGKTAELGNSEQFTVPCRRVHRKEPTIGSATVGKVLSGGHFEVHKNDDLVDKENCRTPGQIEDVKYHFGMMTPLLETHEIPGDAHDSQAGWRDVAGTRYDFSDLYGSLIDGEEKLPEERRTWNIVVRSAAPNWPDGPFLWPERMGRRALKEVEDDPTAGPQVLSSQYLMKPIVSGQGLVNDEREIQWIPRHRLDVLLPRLTLYGALDLAGMDASSLGIDNDYSCLAVGGFARDGRLYVIKMWHGRPDPETVIRWIFEAFQLFPRMLKLKIEKEAHARVLLPFLRRDMARKEKWLPIDPQPRSNQQSKKDKIRGLQPWFKQGGITFVEDLPCKTSLISEIKGFPKYRHDDILDTLTDLMHERDGVNPDIAGRPKYETYGEESIYGRMQAIAEYIEDQQIDAVFHRFDEQGAVNSLTGM